MNIPELTSKLRAKLEEIMFTYSNTIEHDNTEFHKSILLEQLKIKKEYIISLDDYNETRIKQLSLDIKKQDNKFFGDSSFERGAKAALSARKISYVTDLQKVNQQIEILKLI